jgi:hypothetical protein
MSFLRWAQATQPDLVTHVDTNMKINLT